MKDLTDYIVQEDGKFFVDVWDADTGEPVFEVGEVFCFEYEGELYKGMAQGDDDEGAEVLLVME